MSVGEDAIVQTQATRSAIGELLRAGSDERLDVDAAELHFLFQGVRERDRQGRPYGEIPWKLGLLQPAADR